MRSQYSLRLAPACPRPTVILRPSFPLQATVVPLASIGGGKNEIDLLVEAAIQAAENTDPHDKEAADSAAAAAAARKAAALRPDTKLFGDDTRKPMLQKTIDGSATPAAAAVG